MMVGDNGGMDFGARTNTGALGLGWRKVEWSRKDRRAIHVKIVGQLNSFSVTVQWEWMVTDGCVTRKMWKCLLVLSNDSGQILQAMILLL